MCTWTWDHTYADEKNREIVLFAAASTTHAVNAVLSIYTREHGGTVIPSFASSSTLAKQIDRGAPAELFLCANPKWMDYLEKRDMIETETRKDLLGNRMVLIVPGRVSKSDSTLPGGARFSTLGPDLDLIPILDQGKNRGILAMGDPDHVPAGIYGMQALTSLGLWPEIASRIARAKDVRAALVLVERAEASAGIVYATDALGSKRVMVEGVFPEHLHEPIKYPLAIIQGRSTPRTRELAAFLQSEAALAVFKTYGFTGL
ncbi:MAG: molybdate ABC transporter substrate-binding protein [Desulfobacteraceae bacterium]|nr:MAG: molybdate ABC transporter substrate-binding protein [Desulfobacteraceae bacterium]